jgi:hypothetical protein
MIDVIQYTGINNNNNNNNNNNIVFKFVNNNQL